MQNELAKSILRNYNQVVMFHNILEDNGKDSALEFLESIGEKDKSSMLLLDEYRKRHGVEKLKQFVNKSVANLSFSDE